MDLRMDWLNFIEKLYFTNVGLFLLTQSDNMKSICPNHL